MREEILPFVIKQKNFEGILPHEVNQADKGKYLIVSHICVIKIRETRRNREWHGGYLRQDGEMRRYWSESINFQVYD